MSGSCEYLVDFNIDIAYGTVLTVAHSIHHLGSVGHIEVSGLGYTYRFLRHRKCVSHNDAMDTHSP